MNKPIVGITMGDPAGSGPEITIKALADPEQYSYCRPIVVGDVKVMEQAKKFVGREDIVIHRCEKVSDALFTPGTIDVLHLDLIEDISKFEMAKVSVEGGNAAFQCVKKVIELAMAGEVDATCTNALNKEAMNKALEYYHGEKSDGYTHFDGHTEIYATYTHTKKYTMMLAHHDLRVVHVSTHVSLREACDRVKKDRVLEVIEIANKACKDMGIENPRIAVAGLNPHCGENGLFGRRRSRRSPPPSKPPRPRASPALWVPARRTACSRRPSAAGTTSWCVCTTIRVTSPSRPWALSTTAKSRSGRPWRASTSRWVCPSSVPAWITAPTSTTPARATATS